MRPRGFAHSALVAVCLATAVAARSSDIFKRDSTCPDATQNHCSQAGLPSNFCCPDTTTCLPLAGNTTVLCCPSGNNCAQIQPIICDIQQQNVTLHPNNQLKTQFLNVSMQACNGGCCPFGYSCNDGGNCALNPDQTQKPSNASSAASSSTSTSKPSATSSTGPTSTSSTSSSSNTTVPHIVSTCSKFPVTAVLVGFFPGMLLGTLLALGLLICFGSRKQKRNSNSSWGNISDPQRTSAVRTDFLRKMPNSPSTANTDSPQRRKTISRVRSIFSKSPPSADSRNMAMPSPPQPPIPLNIRRPQPGQVPVTPPMQRQASFADDGYQNITIHTDTDTASSLRAREQNGFGRNQFLGGGDYGRDRDTMATDVTRMSHMMAASGVKAPAGLVKNQPFVYRAGSPGYTPSPKGSR